MTQKCHGDQALSLYVCLSLTLPFSLSLSLPLSTVMAAKRPRCREISRQDSSHSGAAQQRVGPVELFSVGFTVQTLQGRVSQLPQHTIVTSH